ncbi:hypothetical protein D3C87_1036880 [compost metagenome]
MTNLQTPGPDHRRQPQHQRRPESSMCQGIQPFTELRPRRQEQRATQQLHSERGEHEGARWQAQANQQRQHPGQSPTDHRAVAEEKQRRQQIEKRQPEARQDWQTFQLPRPDLFRQGFTQLVEAEQQRDAQ